MEKSFEAISAHQGWNEESEIIHLKAFIVQKGLANELAAYAEAVASEENSAECL